MRVLNIVGKSTGGIRQHVNSLNAELKSRNVESKIIAPVGTMNGLCEVDASYRVPRLSRPLSIMQCAKAVRDLISENDVLHAHGLIAALVALRARKMAKSKIPIVMTMHNLVEKQLEGTKYLIKHKIESNIISKLDYIICPSDYASGHAELSTNGKVKIKTILPIGKRVSQSTIEESNRSKKLTRDKFFISQDAPLCISLSRYTAQKDIPTLINSFKLVCEKLPDAQLIVAGHGSAKQTIRFQELIQKHDLEKNIHLYGNIDNPEHLIAAADLFVLSSIYETVPLVLLEALQFSTPVVMTDVGIAKQVLSGDAGTYVPIKNPALLSFNIVEWLNKIREEKIDYSQISKMVNELISSGQTVTPIIEIYEELASDSALT